MPILPGRRERLRPGGYPTRREAIAARGALLGDGNTATAEGWTMQRWLRYWLTTRTKIRPTTLRSYVIHAENHLIPHLGRLRLSELTGRHITDMWLTDLLAHTAEAIAKLVLAAARNPGHRHRRSVPQRNPLGRPRSTPQTGP